MRSGFPSCLTYEQRGGPEASGGLVPTVPDTTPIMAMAGIDKPSPQGLPKSYDQILATAVKLKFAPVAGTFIDPRVFEVVRRMPVPLSAVIE